MVGAGRAVVSAADVAGARGTASHVGQPLPHLTHSAGTERQFTFDFSYNSFVPRDDEEYASQHTVWTDLGVGILNNAFEGEQSPRMRIRCGSQSAGARACPAQ